MHRMYALLGVAILAVATSVANAEVLELSQDTFDSLAFTKEFALIEFYAPWCGHCKALEPEYTRLGDTIVSDFGVDNVVIAKIDATAAEALAEQYGIQGFPTIKFFRSSDRKSIDYMNEPSYDGLVEFIQDNILPPAIEVEVWQDVEEARKSDSLFILGYFPGDAAGAQRFKDVAFGSSMTHLLAEKRFPEIEEVYDVTGSAVVVVPAKGGDIVKLADADIAETGAMTAAIRRTLISQFSQWDEDNLDIALESGIEYFGLLFREPSDADILSLFSKMAPKMPSNFVAMYAGDADDHLVEFFEIDPSSLPQFRILYLKNEQEEPVVYSYDQANLTEVGVLDFIARTFDGTVEPTALLTDPYAETPDGYEDEDLASPMEDQYGDVHEEL